MAAFDVSFSFWIGLGGLVGENLNLVLESVGDWGRLWPEFNRRKSFGSLSRALPSSFSLDLFIVKGFFYIII